eukprot:TRINITY_DN35487_c0_g1_i1.p1 TRINITY_DN35487_c0_g1~~TRINITY_DN35487_c0_g1_i1.p1  ORF type:complete len:405 (+),score=186.73 TRINITY_DN35487_c0_g1_i1:139-1215(+)
MGGVEHVEVPRTSAEGTATKFTMDEFEERMKTTANELENMSQETGNKPSIDPEAPDASEVLQRSYNKFKATETQQNRISEQDGLFNMTPSGIKAEPIRAVKRFYKKVDVEPASAPTEGGAQWWAVKLDSRNAKAFESEDNLVLPSEEFALAVAKEWDDQQSVINRFSMPLMDVASGAHQVQPDGLPARINYCLEFFKHDHMFYREEHIRAEQDEMMEPILEWADRYYDIKTPRVEGIRRCTVDVEDIEKMRRSLELMNMNKYQIVALTVLCQYMSSLVLPLAVFNNATTLEIALLINRIEEMANIKATTEIEGYHDIRHLDSVVKMAACRTTWDLVKAIAPADCYAEPSLLRKVASTA